MDDTDQVDLQSVLEPFRYKIISGGTKLGSKIKIQCHCGEIFISTARLILSSKSPRCKSCRQLWLKGELQIKGVRLVHDQWIDTMYSRQLFECNNCALQFTSSCQSLITLKNNIPCGCFGFRMRNYNKDNKYINKTFKGLKVGKLTVISNLIFRDYLNRLCVRAICECGHMTNLQTGRINHTPDDFGCKYCKGKRAVQSRIACHKGDRYGRLQVVSDLKPGKIQSYVDVLCDCGRQECCLVNKLRSGKKIQCNSCRIENAQKLREQSVDNYLAKYGFVRMSSLPTWKSDVLFTCSCGKNGRKRYKHIQQLMQKNIKLYCRCSTYVRGVRTSGIVFGLHATLNKGVHNFKAKAGTIDIAIIQDGKKIAIEYDEWHWHRNDRGRDLKKTRNLLSDGWYVLRIRANFKIPKKRFLQKKINKLLKTSSRLLLVTHKSWKGYDD